jgi:hypothetical protein
MKVYDFSFYAAKRDAKKAESEISQLKTTLNEPGAVIRLKDILGSWIELHREILKKAS